MRFTVHYPSLSWGWRLQCPPLQEARRRLLTRCAGCGGKSTRARPVNVSLSWDPPTGRPWHGERGLYHGGCEPR